MKVTVIPIVVGALGTVPKTLKKRLEELEIRRRIEATVLRSARILRKPEETSCHSNSSEIPAANAGVISASPQTGFDKRFFL